MIQYPILASKQYVVQDTTMMHIIIGRKSSFNKDNVPIFMNLTFSMPNPCSMFMYVEECIRLNQFFF